MSRYAPEDQFGPELKGTSHIFNKEKEQPQKERHKAFWKQKSPDKLGATSMVCARGFNREVIGRYFNLLETNVDENNLNAGQIFIIEYGWIWYFDSAENASKSYCQNEKHQIGSFVSGKRGMNINNVTCCVPVTGCYVPPLIILFKRNKAPKALRRLTTCVTSDVQWRLFYDPVGTFQSASKSREGK